MKSRTWLSLLSLGLMIFSAACNLPKATAEANSKATEIVETAAALLTGTAASLPTPVPATETPIPADTSTPTQVSTPKPPAVISDALCWVGPGSQYEVVSAIRAGTQVELLGQGSVAGWLVVRNPIYHDPCWIEASRVQIDSGYDLSGLKIIYPPPTPTLTPTLTPTSTATPTP